MFSIFWGEVYVESDGRHLGWCHNNERVPLNMMPTADGSPHIGAMTKAGDSKNMYLISVNDNITVDRVFCYKAARLLGFQEY